MASSKDMQPLGSPFFPHIFIQNQFRTKPVWPPKDTNLTGKVAIVTGANVGLGLEASDQLLSFRLSRLIIAVRSVAKGKAAAEKLRAKYPGCKIDVFQLDMSSYDSIRAFTAQVDEQLERVDMAILNAGVRKTKFELVSGTGHEETIQVNYLSTALLCILLLPILKRKAVGGPGRITIVGSGLAFVSKFPNRTASPLLLSFDDAGSFDSMERYNVAKLLGMMFLCKLADHVSADDVVVNVVDPGFVKGTGLSRDMSGVASALMSAWKQVAARPLKVGASTYVDAAVVKGKESHGCYLMSWKISP
jgi:NAD(P)-dependent dehydrogenase (short-subunit alcohol dehydrogenase family)